MEKYTCEKAKQIDLVEYLAFLGHQPEKVTQGNYMYKSPLREERTASFKVDRQLNVWYDHGIGKGGDLIDFGTMYHKCNVSELLERLSRYDGRPLLSLDSINATARSRQQAGEKKDNPAARIVIINTRPLTDKSLLQYLEKRCIPLAIASRFCKEVDFLLYNKKQTVVGFQNNSGGYELRNENFKGSSSPKDISYFNNGKQQVAVFEGFFSFMAFQTLNKNPHTSMSNFLILNSLSFFEKSRAIMENHERVHLFLDRDIAGKQRTQQALQWHAHKYTDRSMFYENRKDFNEWLIQHRLSQELISKIQRHR